MHCTLSDTGLVRCWTEGGVFSAGDVIVVMGAITGMILESPFFYLCVLRITNTVATPPEGKLSLQGQVPLSDSSSCHLCQETVSGWDP